MTISTVFLIKPLITVNTKLYFKACHFLSGSIGTNYTDLRICNLFFTFLCLPGFVCLFMQFIPRLFVSEIPIVTYSNKFYNTQILKSLIKTELKNL